MYLLWILIKMCYTYDPSFICGTMSNIISICKFLYKYQKKREKQQYKYILYRYEQEDDLIIIE